MVSGMVKAITGGYKIKCSPTPLTSQPNFSLISRACRYHPDGPDGVELDIDFTPPFRRIPLIKGLEEAAKIKIPLPLESDECNQFLKDCCKRFQVDCGMPHTTTRLLDKLVGHFLEEQLVNPGFIIDHPQVRCVAAGLA